MPKITKKINKTKSPAKTKINARKKKEAKIRPTTKKDYEQQKEAKKPKIDYFLTVGRRKSSVARVRYHHKGRGEIIINGKDYKEYFPYFEYQKIVLEPLNLVNKTGLGKFSIKVTGGGWRGQAESIRLGISRILLKIDKQLKFILKSKKLLTRDPRVKERKKYGLKKARRAPQWQKR